MRIKQRQTFAILAAVIFLPLLPSVAPCDETLPVLKNGKAPQNFAEMWNGFDPREEPLETETLHEWEEDGVVLRILRFRIGVFKGQKARLAAIYGYPKNASAKVPGLLQIHGGGQYADYKACLTNAHRGYATLSIAWAGRISAPKYRVTPAEVKLFWENDTSNPQYRETTDWGAVDGYHAPGRNAGNQFPSAKAASWTLDGVESPRNSGWFLCALAARRALTFLENQPEVDPARLGVYGHSMGGKLTVMTSFDPRVKAAAPSCGGISDRYNRSELFRDTLGDNHSLKQITCPIIFLSPANDFHGRISDLPAAIREIQSEDWRVTCSPHHNHQDTPPYEVATQLWFDQHLKQTLKMPGTPQASLVLKTTGGVPQLTVKPDRADDVLTVDVFYTQDGKAVELPSDIHWTKYRFWQHAQATNKDGVWTASLPVHSSDKPLWVFANVRYPLKQPVTGAGYYYGVYTARTFNLSSLLIRKSAEDLQAAGVQPVIETSTLIEDFKGDWEKEWFTLRPTEWARTTNKLRSEIWQAPAGALLSLKVKSAEPNTLVIVIDGFATEAALQGGAEWQTLTFSPGDFKNVAGDALPGWKDVKQLKLTHAETLRPARRQQAALKRLGGRWKGAAPQFSELRWVEDKPAALP